MLGRGSSLCKGIGVIFRRGMLEVGVIGIEWDYELER